MPPGRTCGTRRAVVAAAAVLAVVGCTSPAPDGADPSPTPAEVEETGASGSESTGTRIAVVVPPSGQVAVAEAAALASAAEALAEDPPQGVETIRVTRATSSAFARDLAHLAADDGYDVVCIVGTGAAELALELARSRRETRVCTTDGRITGGPVNLVAVAVDPVALVQAGAAAIGTAPAPVGLLVSQQVGDGEALAAAFTAAVAPPRQEPPPSPAPTPTAEADDAASPAAPTGSPSPTAVAPEDAFVVEMPSGGTTSQLTAAEELAEERPSRTLVLATPSGTGVAEAVAAAGGQVVVVADWAVGDEGELPPNLLVALTVDWAALLTGALEAARTPGTPQVQLLGIDAGVLGAQPGQGAEAEAAAERTAQHLEPSDD